MLATKAKVLEAKIGTGDDMFFLGLFAPYFGQTKNYPIVRFGKVALLTDERVPWKERKDQPIKTLELYLAELQSWAGNSGSPVFFYLDPTRDPGTIRIGPPALLLAGVMKGYFYSDPTEIFSIESAQKQYSHGNIGIAAVTPAYKLFKLLQSDEVKNLRK